MSNNCLLVKSEFSNVCEMGDNTSYEVKPVETVRPNYEISFSGISEVGVFIQSANE